MPRYQIAQDIELSDEEHHTLLHYLLGHARAGFHFRDDYKTRWERIDREINSYIQLDQGDAERDSKNAKGHGVSPIKRKSDLCFRHLTEAITYIASVLAPDSEMYEVVAPKDKMQAARSFSAKMNKDAQVFDHYGSLLLTVLDALRYNFAPIHTVWKEQHGMKITNSEAGAAGVEGQANIERAIIWTGNAVNAIDPYNFTFDNSVKLSCLHSEGQYAGFIDVMTEFRLRQLFAKAKAFGWKQFIDEHPGGTSWVSSLFYENERRILSPHLFGDSSSPMAGENWTKVFAAAEGMQVPGHERLGAAHSVMTLYIHLPPGPFALRPRTDENEEYSIWEFKILNEKQIIFGEQMPNSHGYLPISIAHSMYDRTLDVMTFAERLASLQEQESFSINAHVMETRRGINGGLTAYDKEKFPALEGDDVDIWGGGKVAATNLKEGDDIRRYITQINADTRIQDLAAVLQVTEEQAQAVLPTAQAQQVAGLDRATQFQAAAVVQSASRSNLIISRRIDTTGLIPSRHMQHRNLLAFGEQQEIIMQDGTLQTTQPSEWRESQLEFATASGLRGLDRLAYILNMKELMALIVQNQQAAQGFDIVALFNYVSQLFGDYTDMTQFRIQSPIDALPPEQKQLAFELLQQQLAGQQQAAGQPAAG